MVGGLDRGPHEEQLVRRLLAVMEVAAGQAVVSREIGRRHELVGHDTVGQRGGDLRELAEHRLHEGRATFVGPAPLESLGDAMREHRHHRVAFRAQ